MDEKNLFVGTYFRILLVIVLLSPYPSRDQVVLDAVWQGEKVISTCGHITILYKGIMKMSVESLLEIRYVLHINNSTHRDLFPLLVIRLWGWHFYLLILSFFYDDYQPSIVLSAACTLLIALKTIDFGLEYVKFNSIFSRFCETYLCRIFNRTCIIEMLCWIAWTFTHVQQYAGTVVKDLC